MSTEGKVPQWSHSSTFSDASTWGTTAVCSPSDTQGADPQLSSSQVALQSLGSSLCWIQTAMKRRSYVLSGLHLIPRSNTPQAIFSCLLLFLPVAQRHQTRPIVHGLGQGAMHKADPKSFISSALLSDTFPTFST